MWLMVYIILVGGALSLCFPAYGFLFPSREVTAFSLEIFTGYLIVFGFGFVGGSLIWESLSKSATMSSASPIQPFTTGAIISGLIGELVYIYLLACLLAYLIHKYKKR